MKKLFTFATFIFIATLAFAQPGNPANPVPIDGGISLLIAAGAAFGAKKIYDARKAE